MATESAGPFKLKAMLGIAPTTLGWLRTYRMVVDRFKCWLVTAQSNLATANLSFQPT
jgi:hypothetical protein